MAKAKGWVREETGRVRCAIYTRKSTDEGLEQEFNSLDAQREACAAYIVSQRHEGWVELPELYDDGGYSGGNMERPALKRLLDDVATGKVDVIVLYKIDRLTRSLADFARIVEILDGAGASFVSITQAFNTTSSMGRLTLNVLLSFAQFEREMTGERIRDKVAASKARGMWMGGVVPLGYRVHERKLVIDEAEAGTVRLMFDRYVALGSTTKLALELERAGIVSKVRILRNGEVLGGRLLSRGALSHLLQSRVYVGEVTHRDQIYPGQHDAIIERSLWDKAQALLALNRRERRTSARARDPSLLAGIIDDGLGRPMTPTHAAKGVRRYRYYQSRLSGGDEARRWSLPARPVEQLVIARIVQFAGEGAAIAERLLSPSLETIELVRHRCADLGEQLAKAPPAPAREILLALETRVQVHDDRIAIELGATGLFGLAFEGDCAVLAPTLDGTRPFRLSVPVKTRRRGQELKLIVPPGNLPAITRPDPILVKLIVKAHDAYKLLQRDEGGIQPCERPHLSRLARLAYLAPDIVSSIMEGRQPVELTARSLLRTADLPMCWQQQRAKLGFG